MPSDRPDLDAYAAKWSKIIGVQDVEKAICYKRAHDMPDARGKCDFQIESGLAVISIRDPGDCDPNEPFPYDFEQTLVHELLHIPFEYVWPTQDEDDMRYKIAEQQLDKLSRAFIRLQRRIEELEAKCGES